MTTLAEGQRRGKKKGKKSIHAEVLVKPKKKPGRRQGNATNHDREEKCAHNTTANQTNRRGSRKKNRNERKKKNDQRQNGENDRKKPFGEKTYERNQGNPRTIAETMVSGGGKSYGGWINRSRGVGGRGKRPCTGNVFRNGPLCVFRPSQRVPSLGPANREGGGESL